MALRTLLRELSELPQQSRIYIQENVLYIGKDYWYSLPTKFDREMEEIFESRNNVSPDPQRPREEKVREPDDGEEENGTFNTNN